MAWLETLKESNEIFKNCSKKLKILSVLSWGRDVADDFFLKKKEMLPPTPTYKINTEGMQKLIESLNSLEPKLKGEHPVLMWLSETRKSYLQACHMLLTVETPEFYRHSSELYGNPSSKPYKGTLSNDALAKAIESRVKLSQLNDISESVLQLSAEEFADELEKRLKLRNPQLPVKVELADDIAAKVVSGPSKVKIRRGTKFAKLEVKSLWSHEIETHCLTANNGMLQNPCDFLFSGGPGTTMTQEGLAVFFEMYLHSLTQRRFLALCHRVQAIQKVIEGADFMELYRWYQPRCINSLEAFYSTSRIFRGASLKGGAPFTKDVVYLAGLLGVTNFLRLAIKSQNHLLVETLICGRMRLEDISVIAWLRKKGIVQPPKYLPDWLENWEGLLSFFSFSAILTSVDITPYQSYFDELKMFREWDLTL